MRIGDVFAVITYEKSPEWDGAFGWSLKTRWIRRI